MATISTKNPLVLAGDFVKNYRQFESYMKHCLNILKTQNWLKEHQLDTEVSDYEYIREYMYKNGITPYLLFEANKLFTSKVVPTLPQEAMAIINTNRYYLDGLHNVMQMFAELGNISNRLVTEGNNNLPAGKNIRQDNRFTRLYHQVLKNGQVDLEDKEYTEDEILELILMGKIMVVRSDIQRVNCSEQEILERIQEGSIDFVNRDFTGGFVFESNVGDSFDLFEAKNEDERRRWFAKNMLLLRYFRRCQMTFDRQEKEDKMLHCYKSFDATSEHIDIVANEVVRNFVRRKKKVPENYSSLIASTKAKRDAEKQRFDAFVKPDNVSIVDADFEAVE